MKSPDCVRVHLDFADFPAEEALLNQKHAEGYAFVRWSVGNRLRFAPTEGGACRYRLDFCPQRGEEAQWLAQLRSHGWEPLGKLHGWHCLRRPGEGDDSSAEEAAGLLHDLVTRATHARKRAEREMLLGVAPMALFYALGLLFKNTALAGTLWTLATLFFIVALALVFPALQARGKCGSLIADWYTQQERLKKQSLQKENE